jgi:CHAT domain-containing protein
MKKILELSLIWLVFFSLSMISMISAASWTELLNQAEFLEKADDPDSAIVILKGALKEVVRHFGETDTTVALILQQIAVDTRSAGNNREADSLFKKALKIREGMLDSLETFLEPNHLDLAVHLDGLANLWDAWNSLNDRNKEREEDSCLSRALAIRKKALSPKHIDVARSLRRLARNYHRQKEFAEAESLYNEALGIIEDTLGRDHPEAVITLKDMAWECCIQGKYTEAELFLDRAGTIADRYQGNDRLLLADILDEKASCYERQRRDSSSVQLRDSSLQIREQVLGEDHPDLLFPIGVLAIGYSRMDSSARAESLYHRALSISAKTFGLDSPDYVFRLGQLSSHYWQRGKYDKALDLDMDQLERLQKRYGPNDNRVTQQMGLIAGLYEDLEKYTEAESLLQKVLVKTQETFGPKHGYVAECYTDLADLYIKQDEFARAESALTQAIQIFHEELDSNHRFVLDSELGLSVLYMIQSKSLKAESLYSHVVSLSKTAPDEGPLALLARYSDGSYSGRLIKGVTGLLGSYSWFYRSIGDFGRALETARLAFERKLNSFQNVISILVERDALTNSRSLKYYANRYFSFYFDSGLQDTALARYTVDIALASKGAVSDEIFRRQKRLQELMAENAEAEVIKLAAAASDASLQSSKLFHTEIARPTWTRPRQFAQLDNLINNGKELESKLTRLAVPREELREHDTVTCDSIASALPDRSILVEFVKYNHMRTESDSGIPRYSAVVVGRTEAPRIVEIGEAETIDSIVEKYRTTMCSVVRKDTLLITSKGTLVVTEIEQLKYEEVARELYDATMSEIEPYIPDKHTVFVSPDGALNLVSFGTLIDKKRKYLVDKYPIHYLSAGRDLLRFKDAEKPGSGLLAMGDADFNATQRSWWKYIYQKELDSLPKTREEIDSVCKYWGRNYREELKECFYHTGASEENFKGKATGKRVIHLATHGFYLHDTLFASVQRPELKELGPIATENPLLPSGLLLAGANPHGTGTDSLGDDGFLTAEEVTAMDLSGVQMVVLSACETGLGTIEANEGVYGLRRAFLMAGARTVVVSLWELEDITAMEMMSKLYFRKRDNLPKMMQEIAKDQKERHPAHPWSWGGFIAIGDWR